MVRIAVVVVLVAVVAGRADAQQDQTPPELLRFRIAPVRFDTEAHAVSVDWCVEAKDSSSGLEFAAVRFLLPSIVDQPALYPVGIPQGEACGSTVFPESYPHGIYLFDLLLSDTVGNLTRYVVNPPPGFLDLCSVGPCYVMNRSVLGLPDADGDGTPDDGDNCLAIGNSSQADRDLDLIGDACDLCPVYPTGDNADFDDNGIGDECECGDQTGDGTVNVTDLVAINRAIFGSVPRSPLCDTNYDDAYDVQDIVGANRKIFGRPAYCSRYPPPEP